MHFSHLSNFIYCFCRILFDKGHFVLSVGTKQVTGSEWELNSKKRKNRKYNRGSLSLSRTFLHMDLML